MAVGQTLADVPEPCTHFSWDLSREFAIFQSSAATLHAGRSVEAAPEAALGQLYLLELAAESSVAFAARPGGRRPLADAQAGIVVFTVSTAGHFRVSVDTPVWIDVVAAGGVVDSSAFAGNATCGLIHKSVDFNLPAGERLVLQVSKSSSAIVRLAITPAGSAPGSAPVRR
jgi:hypothetical protein